MEKRDYVNLQEIEKQAKSPDYKGTINVNAISEQEIVKPYIEKILDEINHLNSSGGFTDYNSYCDIFDFVDNLLTEQGEKQ